MDPMTMICRSNIIIDYSCFKDLYLQQELMVLGPRATDRAGKLENAEKQTALFNFPLDSS